MDATQDKIREQTQRVVDISLDDPHPRVRWAAIEVILSSISDDPKVRVTYLIEFLPGLVNIIRSSASIYPRVKLKATIAVRRLIKMCDDEGYVRSFSEDLVPDLLKLLRQGVFRFNVMEILGSLAASFPVVFRSHYKETVDSLTPHVSQWMLGVKTIECLSYIFSWFLRDQSLFVLSDAEKALCELCKLPQNDELLNKTIPVLIQILKNTKDSTRTTLTVDKKQIPTVRMRIWACDLLLSFAVRFQDQFALWASRVSGLLTSLFMNTDDNDIGAAVVQETEIGMATAMLKTLNACIAISGPVFNVDVIKQIALAINQRLSQGTIYWPFNLHHNVFEMEQQQEIIQAATECLETMINTLKSAFLPHVDELLPAVQALWVVMDLCHSESLQLQREAARGIGLCATNTQLISNFDAPKAIDNLYHVIGCALESERRMVYDAAVSALGKICEFRHDIINGPQVVPIWINFLPLKDDFEEAKYAHQQLCRLADPDILELHNKNLEMSITQILNKILLRSDYIATEETICSIISFLTQVGAMT
ncbi:hypothetical protein K1719_029388 [Acacia pycnantha]|nr:hypothetical protein K1719_029388 [Acacia pycnantha]